MVTINKAEVLKMRFDALVVALMGSEVEKDVLIMVDQAKNGPCPRCAKAKAEPQLRRWLMEVAT
jgi:hypothetical protein